MNRKVLLALLLAGLSEKPAVASETNIDPIGLLKSSFVASLSGGASWQNAGKTQTLNLTPDILKTYVANNSTTTLPNGQLFLGIQRVLPKHILGQIGVEFAATENANLSGVIWDDADPQFDNYTYQYQVQHTHIVLKGKLLGDWSLPLLPWISAAMGVGFNNAQSFMSTPTIFEAVSMPNFKDQTTTAFTYAIGLGVQKQLTKNWQIGVGFEFADWGKSQLGAADGETTGQSLSLSHLYTQSVLFNLTYLA